MTATLEVALLWARRGWPVVPLIGKVPAIRGSEGYSEATTDEAQVRQLWREAERVTGVGSIVQPGFVIVDMEPTVDRESGLNGLAECRARLGHLSPIMGEDNFRVQTARGGFHVWWRTAEELPPVDRLGAKIELLRPGRWCVLPGSRLRLEDGRVGEYRKLPGAERPAPMPSDWRAHVVSLADELAAARAERERVRAEVAPRRIGFEGDAIAEWQSARLEWDQLLPEWGLVPAGRGAWRHPADPHGQSAAVGRDGRLRVFSTSAAGALGVEQGVGLTKFQVWAKARFSGDGSAAAREARAERDRLEPRRASRRIG